MAEELTLDPQDKVVIENILKKQPTELNNNDKAILRARWSYIGLFMGRRSQQRFLEVLNQPDTEEVVTEDTNETPDHSHPADTADASDDGADE